MVRPLVAVAVVVIFTFVAAPIFLFPFSILIEQSAFESLAGLRMAVAPGVILRALDHFLLMITFLLWIVPSVLAVGFALRSRWRSRWQWGLLVSLALTVLFFGFLAWRDKDWVRLWGVILAGCTLAAEVVAWVRRFVPRPAAMCGLIVAVLILFAPDGYRLATAESTGPIPRLMWSVVLQKGTWQAMNTGSDFGATRQVVIVGDRVIAVFDAGITGYEGKVPMSRFRILSLDRATGVVANQMEYVGPWGAQPGLFGTSEEQVILEKGSLQRVTPELARVGEPIVPAKGRVEGISADGATLEYQTDPGTKLLDAATFSVLHTLSESAANSFSRDALLMIGVKQGRNPVEFVDLVGALGRKTIHEGCGGPPVFLSEERILFVGCGWIRILDREGRTAAERRDLEDAYGFGGASRNGARFALQAYDERGDPQKLLYERFYVYDSKTLKPLATIPVTDLAERQSWTAFSGDGHFFVIGNPNKLSLYEIP